MKQHLQLSEIAQALVTRGKPKKRPKSTFIFRVSLISISADTVTCKTGFPTGAWQNVPTSLTRPGLSLKSS
jgi:hypothetical protein